MEAGPGSMMADLTCRLLSVVHGSTIPRSLLIVSVEARSMRCAVVINLLMAAAGTITCWLCNAQAPALDGLVSGLNALMVLVGERLSRQLARPADRRYPFGYWALETLYTGSRSLVLLGIILFAAIVSIARIVEHLQGANVPVPGSEGSFSIRSPWWPCACCWPPFTTATGCWAAGSARCWWRNDGPPWWMAG